MTIIIYGLATSTCTSRVLATLFEKESSDFILKPVDLFKGEHKKAEFLALQPFGVIPVIQDGDLTLFESRAIARYIADKFADRGTPLHGKSLKDRAKTEQWMEVESQNVNPPLSTAVYELVFKSYKGLQADHAVVEACLAKLDSVFQVYEEHLSKNKYLAGDFFSLGDLSHIPYMHYLINVAQKGEGITSKKHVNAWWENISSRPSWKKVLELAAQSK